MATSSAVLKIRSEMKMAKKPGGLLRRPLAPIVKPTSVQLKDYSTDTVEMYLNSSSMENGRDHMISPIPSLAPSLASGVQESEVRRGTSSLSAAKSDPYKLSPQQSRVLPHSPVNTLDSRYFLESRFKARTDTGTIGALSLVKPYKPRGPDGLPLRPPKQVPEIKHEYYYQHSDFDLSYSEEQYRSLPEFTLQDFLLDIRRMRKLPKANLQEAMVSKQNFKKLTTLFATFNKLPKQEKINTIEMKTDSIPKAVNRVPQRQLLIETAFLLKQQMKDMMHTDLQAMVGGSETDMQLDFPGREALFGSPDPKYFQGARRSQSPFGKDDIVDDCFPFICSKFTNLDYEDNDSSVITPSELAILDCLVNGGTALSLKAHFIDILPDMSVLNNTLVYLNISFNEFRVFPTEILDIHGLEVLKLRNNPIKEIPHDIYKLKQLHTLVMSFNQISSLPMSLYTLPLVFLDLSYNRISYLPNELKQLKHLREFNIEGNQLAALPCDAFKLRHLRHLKVTNNYMHPLFWKENSTNQPQRLADMAALVIKQRQLDEKHKLPENLQQIIDSASVCDCCKGPLYGSGLRLIRPCSKAFGIWKLPFYFVSCSPYCRDVFMSSTESLSELLYED
ncbi:leucine-rich repeat-containing protein 63-like [Ptychodera flava]|uniref:leucine-rich repeat-containing protein 63-like n=1 Tax=Ptychodera flava TaxID=63121 RepID=UPI00396A8BC9